MPSEVNTHGLPSNVHAIYFVITSYGGKPFSDVETLDASLLVADTEGSEPFAQLPLTGMRPQLLHCYIVRMLALSRCFTGSWAVQHGSTLCKHDCLPIQKLSIVPHKEHLVEDPDKVVGWVPSQCICTSWVPEGLPWVRSASVRIPNPVAFNYLIAYFLPPGAPKHGYH